MDFTEDQRKAIDLRGKNIIVSAAAGSGKTTILVERIIGLILDKENPASLSQMIIVTFTNKAAIEMKDKIRERLRKEISGGNPESKRLKEELKFLSKAHIQTLHAFCGDMLRENFYYLDNFSPNFKILNENQAAIMKKDTIDRVFENEYQELTPAFESFLHNFATSRDDAKAKDAVILTYEKSLSQKDPKAWLEKACQSDLGRDILEKYCREILEDLWKSYEDILDFAGENDLRDKILENLDADIEEVSSFLNLIKAGRRDDFVSSIQNLKFQSIRKTKADDPDLYYQVKEARDTNRETLKGLKSLVLNTDSKTLPIFEDLEGVVLEELKDLCLLFGEGYERAKEEKGALDFNDLEQKFILLLQDPRARDNIKSQYSYIFFDEYQDSNEIQNYIIDLLKTDGKLFFVGDVKQSIYGFRRAEPGLFLEKLKTYGRDENETDERIDLNSNFRSDQELINFNNYIFDRLMTEEASSIDYKNGGHRLSHGKKEDEGENPKVVFSCLSKDLSEAEYVAQEILRLKEEGNAFRDITILLRSSTGAYLYEEALKKYQIPFFSDISKVSFQTSEVYFFINMLKLIENPKDDLTLLSVIRSAIFDFSEDDLAEIKLAGKSQYFYENFEAYRGREDLEEKIGAFKEIFEDLASTLPTLSLFEFGNYVFEKTSYYTYLMARDRGPERVKNVEGLIDLMGDYDGDNNNGLFGFLAYLDNLQRQEASLATPRDLSEKEDLVRLMTIHKSKGLNIPIVILANLDKRFNMADKRMDLVFDDDLGIGINVADYKNKVKLSSIKRNLIIEKIDLKQKQEEMRILYVAMTRAQKKLLLVGQVDLEKKLDKLKNREDFLSMSSYMDRMLAILTRDRVAGAYIDNDFETNAFVDGSLEWRKIDQLEEVEKGHRENLEDFLEEEDYDEDLLLTYRENFSKAYSYQDQVNAQLKKSVTEISENFRNDENSGYQAPRTFYGREDFRPPSFLEGKRKFRASERGTIIHKAFQSLDLKKYSEKSLEETLIKLQENGKFKKDEIDLLQVDKLLAFFNSDLLQDLLKEGPKIRKEESFLMKYEDTYINGQIDLLLEGEDSVVLFDFKTDRQKRPDFYKGQLSFYKRAIEESLGKKVKEAYLFWYEFGDFQKIEF